MSEEKELTAEEAQKKAAEVNAKVNNDRISRMEQIADNSEKGRPEEFDEAEERERAAIAESEAAEAEARRLQAEGAEEAETDSDTKQVNGETYYRQIVNGQERWQSLKEIRESAQKVESADEYLRTASESVRNASRLALSKKDEPARVGKDDLRKLLAAVALGDEEAIEKLASVIDSRPSEVTPDVLRAVDQRLSFRTELAQLESEQSELLEDPYLGRLFRARLDDLKQENPDTPLASAYKSIGKELRERFGATLKSSTIKDKLERKRTLPQVPTAAARQRVEAEEEGEEDVSSVIDKMAKARGYTPHVHTRRQ